MHLKIVKVKKRTKPKKEVVDNKQALYVTCWQQNKYKWLTLKHAVAKKKSTTFLAIFSREEFLKRGSCMIAVMYSKERRRRRNIKTCCVSLEMVVAKFLKT